MAKRRKLKIFIMVSISTITIACASAGVLMWLFHYKPAAAVLFKCYELGQDSYAAARYYCLPYPSSEDWIECRKTKEVWRYLKNETVNKIAFWSVGGYDGNSPDNRGWQIIEPEKMTQTLQMIRTAEKACNISIVWLGRMSIITDKHKFIIPVEIGDDKVYGLDWTSRELRRQLWEWGFGREYKYNLPTKEQTIAILIYPRHFRHYLLDNPLAIFGNKELAEELFFRVGINKAGRSITSSKYSRKLEAKRGYYEGRDWLEKIVDAYEIALKKAEATKKYFPGDPYGLDSRIVFITRDGFYWKPIGIGENTVYDDYIESEQLKAYFDELGLVDELLAEKLSKGNQN